MAPALLLVGSSAEIVFLAVGGLLWLLWATCAAYLLFLVLGAALARRRERPQPAETARVCALIPAHNEALNLPVVLDRLKELDYPADDYTLVVIADNCTDGTAAVAQAHGAEVLERVDADRRGKGYALEWAIGLLLSDPRHFDAFLILDADSVLTPNFLQVMNAALAQGHHAIQGRYDVLNLHEAWRTRLMAVALALAHYVKPLGRNTFGLSDGLKGNGMCFSREVLQKVPWSGESVTEDIEYTLRLVEAGVRIEFAPEAVVYAQMPTSGKQATTQRQRWEGGRYALAKRAFGLLFKGLGKRNLLLADRAIELIIPPFVEMFALPVLFLLGSLAWLYFTPGSAAATLMAWAWGGVLAAEVLYLAAGLVTARVPLAVAGSLLFAPVYIIWKFAVYGAMVARRGVGGWHRTERQAMKNAK
jgi:1,2-diacylglycerol 3-beta-glucosyltransferase